MTFDAGSVSARLEVDRSAFNRDLDAAKADADKFTSKPIQAKITADGTEAKKTLDDLTARADKLGSKAASIKIGADATGANTDLDKTSAKADALSKKDVTIKIKADASQANAEIDKTSAKADALGAKTPTVKVGADTTAADAALDKTSAKADALDKKDVTVKVKADTAGADAALDKTGAKAALLGKQTTTVKVKTDTDTSGIDNLNTKISNLTSGPFSLLKTAIVGLGPATVPVLGAVTAAVLPLTAAIGSAATGLGAFGLVAKSVLTPAEKAATAVGKAQSAYNVAIASGTSQAKAYATEQKAISTAYAGMSAQQIALSKQAGDLQTAWKGVLTSVTPVVSSALVPWMKDVQQLLQYIKPLITPVAALFKSWGDELNRALTGNQANITRFVEAFAGRSVTNIRLFGDALLQFAKGAGALIRDIAPNLAGASGGIVGLATSFAGWAKSQKTADAITAFFTWAKQEMPAVKQFLENAATALGHLTKAAAFTGGGDLKVLTTGLSLIAALPTWTIVALADGYVAISLGLRAASIAMGAWNIISTITKGIQAALNTEIKVTGAALVVQKVALLAIAAATKAWAAAQWLLNAAMDANPIGLLVIALAALAIGIYEAWQHSAAFRDAIKDIGAVCLKMAIQALQAFRSLVVGFLSMVGTVIDGAAKAFGWVPGLGPKLKEAAAKFDGFKAGVNNSFNSMIDKLRGWQGELTSSQSTADKTTAQIKKDFNDQQTAARNAGTALTNYTTAIKDNGVSSDAAKAARQQLIKDLTNAGVNSKTANTDVDNYTTAVKNNGIGSTQAQAARQQLIKDILNASTNAKQGKIDTDNLTTAVQRHGATAQQYAPQRAKLIADLEASGVNAHTATGLVDGLITSVSQIPAQKTVGINVTGKGTWSISQGSALQKALISGTQFAAHGAAGGILPGYAPGQDTLLAAVSPGEAILVPEAVRAIGPANILAWNRAYAGGRVSHGMAFAGGGLVGTTPAPAAGGGPPAPAAPPPAGNGNFAGLGPWTVTQYNNTTAAMAQAVADAMQTAINAAVTAANAVGTGSGADIAAYAKTFLGKIPYVWGGDALGPAGSDCSGFVEAIYKHFGMTAPRSSEEQGSWVKKGPPVSGGLAFYHSPAGGPDPGHVAIVQNAATAISQGGGMGPQLMGLHAMPLLWTGSPPSGFGGGVGAGSPGKGDLIPNASAIGAYLLANGANKIAAAGIMGNMLQESGGQSWQAPGGGLIQIIADGQPSSLAQSLAQTIAYINANGGMGPINAAQTVAQATEIFMNQYERPAPATENLARRLAGAAAAYAAGYAGGGLINAGTGPRSDDVLIRASKGETVVSADHSKVLAPAFSALGVPGYAAGGIIPGYAAGGLIPSSATDKLAAKYLAAWKAHRGGGVGAAWGPTGINKQIAEMQAALNHDSMLAGAAGLTAANRNTYKHDATVDKAKLAVLSKELASLNTFRSDLAAGSGKLGQWIKAAGNVKSLAGNVRAWKSAKSWEDTMVSQINSAIAGPAGPTAAQQASATSSNTTRMATAFLNAWKNRKGGGWGAAWGPVSINPQIDAMNAALQKDTALAGAGGLSAAERGKYSKAAATDKAKLAVLNNELNVMRQYRSDLGGESSTIGTWISAAGSSASLANNVKSWKATKAWEDWQAGQISAALGWSAAQGAANAAAAAAGAAASGGGSSAGSTGGGSSTASGTASTVATLVPGISIGGTLAEFGGIYGIGNGSLATAASSDTVAAMLLDELKQKYGQGILAALNGAGGGGGFDRGGWLQPGTTLVRNNTGRPEPVLSGDQWDRLSSAMAGSGDIGDKLDRIANLLAAQPRATASGVSEVLNGTAHTASFRSRYPRN